MREDKVGPRAWGGCFGAFTASFAGCCSSPASYFYFSRTSPQRPDGLLQFRGQTGAFSLRQVLRRANEAITAVSSAAAHMEPITTAPEVHRYHGTRVPVKW